MNHAPTAPRQRRRSPAFSGFSGGLTLLAAAAMWLLFAPQSFGGQFDYATVRGNSMAPGLVDGDAVLIRRAAHYQVGDPVASRHPELGVVLHRVIAYDGEHYTLQGDNRPARDSYEPTNADIIGKQWARVPHLGAIISWLQRPIVAVVFGAIVLALIGLGATIRKPRRRGRNPGAPPRGGRKRGSLVERLALQGPAGQTIAGSLLLIAIFAAVVAVVHAQATDNETVTHTLAFTESGRFTYGDTVAGGVYDGNRLSAPDPVYLALIDALPVSFEYQLAPFTGGELLRDVVGAHQLLAEVSHPNGWTATIPLSDPTLFAGQAVRADGVVHLDEVMATITNAEDQTGVASLFYTLRIVAIVSSDGTFGGVPFSRSIDSAIQFRLSKEQLQFDVKESALESSTNVTVGRRETIPRVLDVPLTGTQLPFSLFPSISLASFAVALAGFAVIATATRVLSRRDPAAQIQARYSRMLIAVADDADQPRPPVIVHEAAAEPPARRSRRQSARARRAPRTRAERAVRPAPPAPAKQVEVLQPPASAVPPKPLRAAPAAERPGLTVSVESFDDLARIAEQRGLAVLWTTSDEADDYVLLDGDVTYRFAISAAERLRRGGSKRRQRGDEPEAPLRRAS